ncbi:putative phosphatase regulatory subunit [Oesophagostomum dentatum]|uniref:Putative phosphatase regulatory subunit n=1 Tax=Oesophagostomum dentatum TaxID=61180 RepID=A0A0B1TFF8_OESDE|nr:putative phosphatase regulatory subunit [Oesophagostomum dentatum]
MTSATLANEPSTTQMFRQQCTFYRDTEQTEIRGEREKDTARRCTLPSALRRSRSKVCAKRVRFADALGLDLEKRKYFDEKDSNPFPTPPSSPTPEHRLILTNFVYRTESEYNQRAHDDKVCLAKLHTQGRNLNGQINVANIAFTKEVAIRYTTNDWVSYDEVAASYGHNVFGANNVDAFVFSLMLPTDMKDGQCQFCVRFTVEGRDYWDNNNGANYRVNMVQESSSHTVAPHTMVSPPKPTTHHSVTSTSSFFTPRRLRRWVRAQEEPDDESSRVYIPRRRVL